jgi:lysine 6-dehydrogenase
MSAPRVAVLGGGRVGGAMALDLAREGEHEVLVADADAAALARFAGVPHVAVTPADLADPAEVRRVVADADLVVGAVPGFLGFATLRAVLEADKSVVDISFFPEDPFALDELARARGRVAIVDCGVAPGLSNLVAGYHAARLARLERFVTFVGGLPAERRWPYEYKAGFSPIDVLEEYTRPARLVERGEVVVRPALSEPELVDFPGLGTLEAFNTDGLRTVLTTLSCPEMKEKTMRYPGHIELMRVLRESGFFAKEPVEVRGQRVAPLDLTAALLFPLWQFDEGEADLTVMRVEVEGAAADGARKRFVWELLDRYDPATRTTSMARTTGYTATAAVRLLARGAWTRPGIVPPEHLGADETCFRAILADLEARGVRLEQRVQTP